MNYLITEFTYNGEKFNCIFEININNIIFKYENATEYEILRVIKGNDKLIFSVDDNGIYWSWNIECSVTDGYGFYSDTDTLIELETDEDLELFIRLR